MGNIKDITGQKFGKLTVIKRTINDKDGRTMWECQCDCGCKKVVRGKDLRNGKTKSCGCYKKEFLKTRQSPNKKYNRYDLSGEYGIGFTSNTNKEFYFDLEDYDKIKEYCWYEHSGYTYSQINNKDIHMVWIIMGDKHFDHINGNRLDNRKCNLRRFESIAQNMKNKGIYKNNTSGVTGISKNYDKWQARIGVNGESISLGVYTNIKDAIKARKEAEEKYFGEWCRKQEK